MHDSDRYASLIYVVPTRDSISGLSGEVCVPTRDSISGLLGKICADQGLDFWILRDQGLDFWWKLYGGPIRDSDGVSISELVNMKLNRGPIRDSISGLSGEVCVPTRDSISELVNGKCCVPIQRFWEIGKIGGTHPGHLLGNWYICATG